ncbi:indolepyruvate ferredoxin oxidoreductase, alpha and beta subunit [Clostridium aceticum]|uniref:Indolepyruvate ferredoxin oxidoreductase, alpha and beta subunit n=1 Tax=Clostridium aceticum TaxID=84022 RepID=A0A0D8IBS3_9CLOT|nr:ferredoxin family protein [Clostridium aceticum]AKL94803.1 indolepyruvate ferredoxin oxidoreductase, alpha and beta subunit [Clostridium aceticum]KJF27743.1 adenylylsulfate reductase [Clostridium aceticum]
MSIQIDKTKCISCGKCLNICPGNLIAEDEEKKASIKHPKECWGCTACLKECSAEAIKYYLAADIGGKGGHLYSKNCGDSMAWYIVSADHKKYHIKINKKDSNAY